MNTFEKARQFVYRNARPLELARWQFHFENGSSEAVIHALSFYQNEDGGFGHGIESDFLNPNSSPMATWAAAEILNEINFSDKTHPIVTGILRYLESGADFDTQLDQWLNTVPSNNDYPHAVWWTYNGNDGGNYNPTAALAAFILKFAEPSSKLYSKACKIAEKAVKWFNESVPFGENYVTACFVTLYNTLNEYAPDLTDIKLFKKKLCENVKICICPEKEKWAVEYVTRPSDFKITPDSIFYSDNKAAADYECDFIMESQLSDGGFNVTWQWWTDYTEYHVSANRWQSVFAINNMRYLKAYNRI